MGHRVGFYLAIGSAGLALAFVLNVYGLWAAVLVLGLLAIVGWGEVAVYGVELAAEALGLRGYSAGVLVNSLAVLPELFLALSIGLEGVRSGVPELVELAVLSVMVSATFNMVVLGLVVLLARGEGVPTPVEALRVELPLLRATVAAIAVLVLYALVESSYTGRVPLDPLEVSVILLLFYLVYMARVVRTGREEPARRSWRWLPVLGTSILALVAASELLARSIEGLVHGMGVGVAGLVVGIVSSSPEAALNILAALRGYAVSAAFGLVAATATALLLIFPVLGIVLPLPLDQYTVYTLGVLGASLWLVKRSMVNENRIDRNEALLILLFQVAALLLLARV